VSTDARRAAARQRWRERRIFMVKPPARSFATYDPVSGLPFTTANER
jgi:hypothetical protein